MTFRCTDVARITHLTDVLIPTDMKQEYCVMIDVLKLLNPAFGQMRCCRACETLCEAFSPDIYVRQDRTGTAALLQ